MKKRLVFALALALALAFSLTACGGTSGTMEIDSPTLDGITEVTVGDLGKYDLSDEIFGTYSVAIPPEGFTFENTTTEFYKAENDAKVAYIIVYRWENTKGFNLDESTADEAAYDKALTYEIAHNDVMDLDCGLYYSKATIGEQEYFTEVQVFEDGDYYSEIVFLSTEAFE